MRSPAKNASTFEREVRGHGDSNSSEGGFGAEERRLIGALFSCAPKATNVELFSILYAGEKTFTSSSSRPSKSIFAFSTS